MSSDPLTLLHMAAIAICYALAYWNFAALVRDVRSDADASPEKPRNLSLYWPTTDADFYYRNQLYHGPKYSGRRRQMYLYAAIGSALLLLYAMR